MASVRPVASGRPALYIGAMPTLVQTLANPSRFLALSARVLPILALLAAALLAVGLWLSAGAPPDYQQGQTVKIMFIHVPCAWLSMLVYGIVAASSVGYLVFRHPLADVSARTAVPIGAAFTLLALVTGSLWGKPMWGAFWVWDARLTSMLMLLFLYIGLMALRLSVDDEALGAQLTAILAIVGILILPVIKFSVDWWNTLHQPSTRFTSTLDPGFRIPLLVMSVGFTMLFAALHLQGMRNEIHRRRVQALTLAAVERAGAAQPAEAQQ